MFGAHVVPIIVASRCLMERTMRRKEIHLSNDIKTSARAKIKNLLKRHGCFMGRKPFEKLIL